MPNSNTGTLRWKPLKAYVSSIEQALKLDKILLIYKLNVFNENQAKFHLFLRQA